MQLRGLVLVAAGTWRPSSARTNYSYMTYIGAAEQTLQTVGGDDLWDRALLLSGLLRYTHTHHRCIVLMDSATHGNSLGVRRT